MPQLRHCCACKRDYLVPEDPTCDHDTAVGPVGYHPDSMQGPWKDSEEWKQIEACRAVEGFTRTATPNPAAKAAEALDQRFKTSVFSRVVERLWQETH